MNTTITWAQIAAIVAHDAEPQRGTLGIDFGDGVVPWESMRTHEQAEWRDLPDSDLERVETLIFCADADPDFDLEDEAATLLQDGLLDFSDERWIFTCGIEGDDRHGRPDLTRRRLWDNKNERRGVLMTLWRPCDRGEFERAQSVTVWTDGTAEWD